MKYYYMILSIKRYRNILYRHSLKFYQLVRVALAAELLQR